MVHGRFPSGLFGFSFGVLGAFAIVVRCRCRRCLRVGVLGWCLVGFLRLLLLVLLVEQVQQILHVRVGGVEGVLGGVVSSTISGVAERWRGARNRYSLESGEMPVAIVPIIGGRAVIRWRALRYFSSPVVFHDGFPRPQ